LQPGPTGKLKREPAPAVDLAPELVVAGVVQLEFLSPEPPEAAEHLGQDRRVEAAVPLGRKAAEALEPVARLDGEEIDEVASLGATEEREQLVDRELLAAKRGSWSSWLGREEAGVGSQVELGTIVVALDDEAVKPGFTCRC
jgi:hypothetical protein